MPEPLKHRIDRVLITRIANTAHDTWDGFAVPRFVNRVFDADWEQRALKQRVRHVSGCLHEALPDDYRAAIDVLREVSTTVQGWAGLIYPDFVEVYGLDDWETSLPALAHFTPAFSSELAVRPFLVRDLERMVAQMRAWSTDANYHVRRLASEGCRPRLPWAIAIRALKADPRPILPILETLKDDPELYVRRSVANNLNDIAKDHPEVVVDVADRWWRDGDTNRRRLVRH